MKSVVFRYDTWIVTTLSLCSMNAAAPDGASVYGGSVTKNSKKLPSRRVSKGALRRESFV